ncbi:hypothetical protein P0O24_01225 [Methanotrichaceae archaeon M04Ac]|uniref:HK97 gp10 family phage protein n=1 Tax=Candidatus Methanocrinis alkalitolerans TaxID=3033395 RepID=A0ABT5XC35_9EURY|nr:hypothetical protein [Candidatus Methanocrinis alkalitolerans]MDF0592206.1 hypothetical protein [Candidatus Methanocrinis alkalitolerans]
MKSIHRTTSGWKAKELRDVAHELRRHAQSLRDMPNRAVATMMEGKALEALEEAERLKEEALEAMEKARLEAVTVYLGQVEKITAKGPKTYEYYFASWKMGGKVVNKYIGSPRKMTREAATAKARKLKAEALGL